MGVPVYFPIWLMDILLRTKFKSRTLLLLFWSFTLRWISSFEDLEWRGRSLIDILFSYVDFLSIFTSLDMIRLLEEGVQSTIIDRCRPSIVFVLSFYCWKKGNSVEVLRSIGDGVLLLIISSKKEVWELLLTDSSSSFFEFEETSVFWLASELATQNSRARFRR